MICGSTGRLQIKTGSSVQDGGSDTELLTFSEILQHISVQSGEDNFSLESFTLKFKQAKPPQHNKQTNMPT